ncbi:MAG: beta-propeller domain-containing protein [Phycisphaerae bacterium]
MRRIMPVLALLTLAGATCIPTPTGPTTQPPRDAALKPFQSAEEMRTFFADQAVARIAASSSYGGGFGLFSPVAGDTTATGTVPPAPEASGSTSEAGNGDRYSTTNIQEAGVDESDKVKNDGRYLYLLRDNSVRIVQAVPPEGLRQVASVPLPETADSLYLRGDKLIALSHSWGYWGYWGDVRVMSSVGRSAPMGLAEAPGDAGSAEGAAPDDPTTSPPSVIAPAPGAGDMVPLPPEPVVNRVNQTSVTVIDIRDRSAPATLVTLKFDGDLASSRLIGSKLHLVLTATPPLPPDPTPESIREQPVEAWLPDYEIVASDGTTRTGKTLTWQDAWYPANPDGYGITMVITVDVDNPGGEFKPVAITADAGTIYASTSALYVTDTSYDYAAMSSRGDTVVHKFDLTGEAARYVASGLVPGRLLNQYSLGEKDGYLRMASTVQSFNFPGPIILPTPAVGGFGGGASGGTGTVSSAAAAGIAQATSEPAPNGNAVYVLHEGATAGRLEIVGRLEGIAPGEELYSARFVGDRGFLVTFKKVDPLFTIDLTDPANPRLAGQLKVPGYSDYIHIMDDTHLLTIGKDASADMGDFAWYQGVQLSIFDVSDFANPVLLHKEIIGTRGTDSEANSNPKAFNYFKAKDALAIPIDLYEGQTTGPEYGQHTFTGLYVYRVTVAEGFTLLGRISTRDVSASPEWAMMDWWYGYDQYTRGVFIDENVYAVTDSVVKAAPFPTPSSVTATLTLP